MVLAVVGMALSAGPAFAQSIAPSPVVTPTAKPAPSWTIYMGYLTIAVAGLTLIAVVLGYMYQAPGFRRGDKPKAGAAQPSSEQSG